MDNLEKELLGGDVDLEEGLIKHTQSDRSLYSPRKSAESDMRHRTHNTIEAILLLALLYLGWDCIALRYGFWHKCLESTSVTSPMLHLGSNVQTVFFNGSFAAGDSHWRSPPSPELDALWERYVGDTMIAISFDQARAMGKTPEHLMRVPPQLRDEYGDGVLAGPEFSHQVHCLNLIRKYTYFDHYREELEGFNSSPAVMRTHVDHCIDMLRQALMCNPDTALMVSYWIEGRKLPMPDFSTMHKCRNIETMVDWYRDHSVRGDLAGPYPDEKIWKRGQHP